MEQQSLKTVLEEKGRPKSRPRGKTTPYLKKEGDRIRHSCIYVVVGLGYDGKKRVLASVPRTGRENVEDWKKVLRGVLERGLRRVMIVIQDDFSGLLPITKGLFPQNNLMISVNILPKTPRLLLRRSKRNGIITSGGSSIKQDISKLA